MPAEAEPQISTLCCRWKQPWARRESADDFKSVARRLECDEDKGGEAEENFQGPGQTGDGQ